MTKSLVVAAAALAAAGALAADPTDPRSLPIGDGKTTTAGPRRGYVYECSVPPGGGGAERPGPWRHADGTFDLTAKIAVDGRVTWPGRVSFIVRSSRLNVSGNGLPVGSPTGVFPVSPSDDAFQYDRNPNSIAPQQVAYSLPARPRVAARATCLSLGPIGIATNGVAIFDAVDAQNRDAVAHEVQDLCDGHPERSGTYHYHSASSCLKTSGLIGYALDGFPIFGVRENGKLLTNADLEVCHGHMGVVTLRGKHVRTFHYHATLEYPYTLGCYRGTPVRR